MAKRAVIYARFSSDKQRDRSIEDQVALCRTYCEREGFEVAKVYDDRAISGASTLNRLGWLTLMRDARAGKFDIVVAEALDRISRDQEDLAGIHKRLNFASIELRTVQDGLADDMHVGLKGLMGALYLKDLAQKTKRGQAGVVRDARHNGGRSFGYRSVATGERGRLIVDQGEVAIVRRIFENYRDGKSPRDIAAALNREGVAGPRGGVWNTSAIAGSRKRENGILQNSLYVGRIVWNRQSFIKDPETGKRISRPNPRDQWMTAEAPELRIMTDDLWEAVQTRRTARAGGQQHLARPRHLLSGLLKCGDCGSGYVVAGRDSRGPFLVCSRHRETGLCDNRRTLAMTAIEARVLEGIEKQLAAPDLIAEYVREFHRVWNELQHSSARERADGERRLKIINAELASIVDLLLTGLPARSLKERMTALEAERETIEANLAAIDRPPIEFHPNAARAYQQRVQELKVTLAGAEPENREAAMIGIRELVEKIVIRPTGAYKPVDIEIHGQLAALLRAADGSPNRSMGEVVAGVRNSTTHRLSGPMVMIRSRG